MRVYFRNDRRFVSAIAVETIRQHSIRTSLNRHTFSYERFPSSVILEDNLNLVCNTLVLTSNKMTFERLRMSKRVISKKQLVRWQLLCAYIKISAVINFSQNSRVLTRLVQASLLVHNRIRAPGLYDNKIQAWECVKDIRYLRRVFGLFLQT